MRWSGSGIPAHHFGIGTFTKGHVVTRDRLDLLDLELEVEKGGNDEVVACPPATFTKQH